ncbi:3-phytase [Paludisphaera borealis]|uniref:3-phytase n=2 Tax=Paludisphaera borealis TaxID=1387353 RepID=A0A1U7CK13_9BACT|nr:3-phytase [Paludisphaera borealis]
MTPMRKSALTLAAAFAVFSPIQGFAEDVLAPRIVIETETVPHAGDAADDPAVWVHPDDPAQSLVLGTDKKGGVIAFDLAGKRIQEVSPDLRPNNIDVIYGFPMHGGAVDLAVAGTRAEGKQGVAIWRIDAANRRLAEIAPGPAFTVFGGTEPYGTCVYRSPKDQAFYIFVNNKKGKVEQYRLDSPSEGAVRATLVRAFGVGSQTEGCVADDDLGAFYLSEESVGIWKFSAEPDGGTEGVLIAKVGEHGLTADVEGLTIYRGARDAGYLIASSQGSGDFKVFERAGANRFVATIDLGLADVDGLDVVAVPTSARFSRGLFVCQGGKTTGANQNFKYVAWDEIAGDRLLIDASRSVRGR